MYVCMYVLIYVCMYTYMYGTHIYGMYMYVCMAWNFIDVLCACIYVCMYVCLWYFIYVFIYVYVLRKYDSMCKYVCTYMYALYIPVSFFVHGAK